MLICRVASGVAPEGGGQAAPGATPKTESETVPAVEPSDTVAFCEMGAPGARVNVAARLALPAAVKNVLESARATAGSSTAWLTLTDGVKERTRQPVTELDTAPE